MQASTLDDALSIINANEHGNGTAIFTASGAAARKFQNEVQVGMVSMLALPVEVPVGRACVWGGARMFTLVQ